MDIVTNFTVWTMFIVSGGIIDIAGTCNVYSEIPFPCGTFILLGLVGMMFFLFTVWKFPKIYEEQKQDVVK